MPACSRCSAIAAIEALLLALARCPTIAAIEACRAAAIDAVLQAGGDINEITTGGATPLHMCGMGQDNQASTAYVIEKGGIIEAVDTYGYTPLHRMASNNLGVGADALLRAGADPDRANSHGETAMSIARQSHAMGVIQVLRSFSAGKKTTAAKK